MGGRIARNVALYYPDRVYSLTVVNANPGFNALSADEVRRFVTERSNRTPTSMRRLLGSKPRKGAQEGMMAGIEARPDHSDRQTLETAVGQDRDTPHAENPAPPRGT